MKFRRSMLMGLITTAAVMGSMAMTSAASEIYTDPDGDEFYYSYNETIELSLAKDNGDRKVVVPGKLFDMDVVFICT